MKKYLKLLFVAIFATMTLSLASCKDDKDEPEGGDLVGTWKVSDGWDALDMTQYIQFKSDGTCINVVIMGDMWSGINDYLGEDDIEIEYGKWSRSGDTLTINGYDSTIVKLTSSKLEVRQLGITMSYVKVPDSEIEQYLK